MNQYASGSAVDIGYPIRQTDAQYLAEELARRTRQRRMLYATHHAA
jgi:hypothetical protein